VIPSLVLARNLPESFLADYCLPQAYRCRAKVTLCSIMASAMANEPFLQQFTDVIARTFVATCQAFVDGYSSELQMMRRWWKWISSYHLVDPLFSFLRF
jgi:hypothetical protein